MARVVKFLFVSCLVSQFAVSSAYAVNANNVGGLCIELLQICVDLGKACKEASDDFNTSSAECDNAEKVCELEQHKLKVIQGDTPYDQLPPQVQAAVDRANKRIEEACTNSENICQMAKAKYDFRQLVCWSEDVACKLYDKACR